MPGYKAASRERYVPVKQTALIKKRRAVAKCDSGRSFKPDQKCLTNSCVAKINCTGCFEGKSPFMTM